jgi:hypothetical protein
MSTPGTSDDQQQAAQAAGVAAAALSLATTELEYRVELLNRFNQVDRVTSSCRIYTYLQYEHLQDGELVL